MDWFWIWMLSIAGLWLGSVICAWAWMYYSYQFPKDENY